MPLVPELEYCDGVEMLTWIHCNRNDRVNSNTELYSGNCIQDACDPFVLLRYGVSSVVVKVSGRAQFDEETLDL